MKLTYKLIGALAVALSVSGQVEAQTADANTIAVEHVWARATPAGAKAGAVYMTVVNKSAIPDRLLGATTRVADKVSFTALARQTVFPVCVSCLRWIFHPARKSS